MHWQTVVWRLYKQYRSGTGNIERSVKSSSENPLPGDAEGRRRTTFRRRRSIEEPLFGARKLCRKERSGKSYHRWCRCVLYYQRRENSLYQLYARHQRQYQCSIYLRIQEETERIRRRDLEFGYRSNTWTGEEQIQGNHRSFCFGNRNQRYYSYHSAKRR